MEEQPWLKDHRGESIGELEIHHGVLRKMWTLGFGLMYFRDPLFVEQYASAGRLDFESESTYSLAQLNRLKQLIRDAAEEEVCLLRENYSSPEELVRWILADFGRLLNSFLPESVVAEALGQAGSGGVAGDCHGLSEDRPVVSLRRV